MGYYFIIVTVMVLMFLGGIIYAIKEKELYVLLPTLIIMGVTFVTLLFVTSFVATFVPVDSQDIVSTTIEENLDEINKGQFIDLETVTTGKQGRHSDTRVACIINGEKRELKGNVTFKYEGNRAYLITITKKVIPGSKTDLWCNYYPQPEYTIVLPESLSHHTNNQK